MININLSPAEELDNPYWWIPDVAIFGLILLLAMSGVKFYLTSIQNQIDQLTEESKVLESTLESLRPEVERYTNLTAKIQDIDTVRQALSSITESKLTRFLPLILIEHIHNLKPEGVWLTSLEFKNQLVDTSNNVQTTTTPPAGQQAAPASANRSNLSSRMEIELQGQAYDNVILAEFMTLLKATRNQDFDAADLRTQTYFDGVGLYFSDLVPPNQAANISASVPNTVKFKLGATFQERRAATTVAPSISSIMIKNPPEQSKGM